MSRSRVSSNASSSRVASKSGSSRVASAALSGTSTMSGASNVSETARSAVASGMESTMTSRAGDVMVSSMGGKGNNVETIAVEEVVATSLKDRKILASRMIGVGFVGVPPNIKRNKLALAIILHLMFSVNALVLGLIVYGTNKAMKDYCYNPVDPDASSKSFNDGDDYSCSPVSADGFAQGPLGKLVLYLLQFGSLVHTISLAFGVFGSMYLNMPCVLMFMITYLTGYTLMIVGLMLEFFYGKH